MVERLPNGFYRAVHRASGLAALFNADGTPRDTNGGLPIFADVRRRIEVQHEGHQMLARAAEIEARNAGHPCPSWSEGVEARQLRRRAALHFAGLV